MKFMLTWRTRPGSDPTTFGRIAGFGPGWGGYGLIVKDTAFESLPPHPAATMPPIDIAPETEVAFVSDGLNTSTSSEPGRATSAAVIPTSNWWLLTNIVTRREPFQFTRESRRKSLPLTVSRN
jgi:hypothetical protein